MHTSTGENDRMRGTGGGGGGEQQLEGAGRKLPAACVKWHEGSV
jgi:hypothetical protein